MENVMILGKKVFYIPAVNESSLAKKQKREALQSEEKSFELQRHWSQSVDDLIKEREIFNDILDVEMKKGA